MWYLLCPKSQDHRRKNLVLQKANASSNILPEGSVLFLENNQQERDPEPAM